MRDKTTSTDDGKAAGELGTPVTLADEILAEDQAHYDEVDPGMLAGLLDRVRSETVDHAPGPRDHLQQLPTAARVALGGLLAMGCGALFLVAMGTRPDLDAVVATGLASVHVFVIVAALVGIGLALRPAHRSPLGGLAWVGVAALYLLPFALSVIPGLWPGVHEPLPAIAHVTCGTWGAVIALPAAVLVLLLDRSRRPTAWRILLAAAAAGLTAFAWGQWQCPGAHPTHLLIGHSGSGLVAGAAVLAGSWVLGLFRR